MLKVLSNILCDLNPKVKVIGQKAGICDGVPSTSALVYQCIHRHNNIITNINTGPRSTISSQTDGRPRSRGC